MELIVDGKTKTLYALDEKHVLMVFKDDVTGTEGSIDPGGNTVVGQVAGKGLAALKQSTYFFNLLAAHDVPTHFVSADVEQRALTVKRATWYGLEFIVRYKALGSFVRRYGKYVEEGVDLGGLVEITLKDDERGDPLVLDETLDVLGIMPLNQVREAKTLVKKAADVLRQDLKAKGLDLLDIKFEVGHVDGGLVIMDDISTDNMRVVYDGESVSPQDMLRYIGAPSLT